MSLITGQAKLAGVIGFPVAHSRSPLLHNYWLHKHGIDGAYVPMPVHPNHLEKALRGLGALGFRGCNVTVPHKENALMLMDRVDDLARKVGAVNTVIIGEDGALEGCNSDVYGFAKNLEDAGASWKKKKPALVLGAGGAARAVIVALAESGCSTIRLTNRTSDRALALRDVMKDHVQIEVIGWPDRHEAMADISLLVNTTTQGMEGQPALDLDIKTLHEGALVTDLVYTPLMTPLLLEARRRNHPVVDGLGMLLHQAVPGFAAWFGVRPVVDEKARSAVKG